MFVMLFRIIALGKKIRESHYHCCNVVTVFHLLLLVLTFCPHVVKQVDSAHTLAETEKLEKDQLVADIKTLETSISSLRQEVVSSAESLLWIEFVSMWISFVSSAFLFPHPQLYIL